jgi:uncharacterized membrane protein (DUF4010 family)
LAAEAGAGGAYAWLFGEPVFRIIVAFLAGMLIGIEREKARAALARKRHRKPGVEEIVAKEFPGIRTFTLVAIYAAVVGYLWSVKIIDTALASLMLCSFAAVVVVFSAFRLMIARMAGITTIVVLLLDFMLGFLSGVGEILLAASTAVLTTFVLAIKLPAEKIVGKIRYEELLWALELGVVLVVVGPFFLASEASFYGVSLRSLYLFFTLVLASSYLGYVAARLVGGKGLAYTALFGGFANSEATLMALIQLLGSLARRVSFDITVITNTAMVIRNVIIALAAAYASTSGFTAASVAPLLVAALLSSAPILYSWRRSLRELVSASLELENPLRFWAALKTTTLYLFIAWISYMVKEAGLGGLWIVAAVGGFVSSSATILAIYSIGLTRPQQVAALAVIATLAGILNKPLYARMGSKDSEAVRRSLLASLLQAALALPGLLLAEALLP